MKVVKRENVVVELKAEAISSQDDVKDATKRQQLNESKRESNKDEMDVNQQTDEEEQVYTGMMTRSRCKRSKCIFSWIQFVGSNNFELWVVGPGHTTWSKRSFK